MKNNENLGKKHLKNALEIVPSNIREAIYNKINNIIEYEPKIGIMGKTGAGKSSLCNSIFKENVCETSDVEACTRNTQEIQISFGKRSIRICDLPGVGESSERDKEYEKFYRELLPKLDLIIWVIKADDRAFSTDEYFYKKILKPAGWEKKILFVINQVDKIEPFREWDVKNIQPSPSQSKNIDNKKKDITSRMGLTTHPVIAVAASEGYHIPELIEALVRALPKKAQSGVTTQIKKKYQTKEIIEEAQEGFGDTVDDALDTIINVLPKPIAPVVKAVKRTLVKVVKSLWGFFFG